MCNIKKENKSQTLENSRNGKVNNTIVLIRISFAFYFCSQFSTQAKQQQQSKINKSVVCSTQQLNFKYSIQWNL